MNIEERLDRLEQQNRNLRRGLVGLLLLVAVVPLAAFVWRDKQPKIIRCDMLDANFVKARDVRTSYLKARMLEIVLKPHALRLDSNEGIRVAADGGTGKDVAGPKLTVWNGKSSVVLNTDKRRPSVTLIDADGQTRAVLGSVPKEGEKEDSYPRLPPSTLTLYDNKGKVIHQVPK